MIDEIIIKDKSKCSGCNACGNICPVDAIIMKEDNEGFYYPFVNNDKCIKCKACIKICPILNKQQVNSANDKKVYGCYNKNIEMRLKSSSGGFFYVIAEYILKHNGIVYGASFDNSWRVVHTGIDSLDKLEVLMGSKYVESYISEIILREVKLNLDKGRLVLFTGTPCQIGGVKSFLQKDYKNLYTVDFICHGVPSPLVWEKYLKFNYDISKIKNIYFRNKINGWNNFMCMVELKNGNKIYKSPDDDLYMLGFLNNLYLRTSCHACSFKDFSRNSDFTIADCWGALEICPDINDDKGLSAVFIQSRKGEQLFEYLREKLVIKELNSELVIKHNTSMIKSSLVNKNREKFFSYLSQDNLKINKLISKYYFQYGFRKRLSVYLRNKLKNFIRRIRVGV